jgi:hypothetical protein
MKPSVFLTTPAPQLAQDLLKTKGKVKLDAVAWLDSSARYAEFSCVYVFETPKGTLNPLPAQIESLQEEMKILWGKGKYFKLMKRIVTTKLSSMNKGVPKNPCDCTCQRRLSSIGPATST